MPASRIWPQHAEGHGVPVGTEGVEGSVCQPGRYPDEEARWAAVLGRQRAADGAFVYAVRTTGVYCRPSCPSRLPRRENVSFHDRPDDAERLGYRACRRCHPRGASVAERQAAAVAEACRRLDSTEQPTDLQALAHSAGLSRFHFHRVFSRIVGLTPAAYAAGRRAQRVRDGLRDGNRVTEVLYAAGFNSSGRFYAAATDMLGMSPSHFRSGGGGEAIRFAVGACSLGAILVAATSRGVCAILLGDDPAALVRDLEDHFPQAALTGDDSDFESWVATVVGFVEHPARGLHLPLDIRGTAFQLRVWRALSEIPPGSTATYAEVARRLGIPQAARAVAGACAANRLAVAIPCHRVVRSDGSLAGYRWGVERKQALLARESRPEPKRAGPQKSATWCSAHCRYVCAGIPVTRCTVSAVSARRPTMAAALANTNSSTSAGTSRLAARACSGESS